MKTRGMRRLAITCVVMPNESVEKALLESENKIGGVT
jgi:hypothetical protein